MDSVLVGPTANRSTASAIGANDSSHLTFTDAASRAMTGTISIEANSLLDDAVACMHRQRVQALLVKRTIGVSWVQQAVGLITYYDIERRRLHPWPRAPTPGGGGRVRVGGCHDVVR